MRQIHIETLAFQDDMILTSCSVYGKAFSVFGRELDMITQDSLRFYKDHAVYPQFGGVVLDREEGKRIAKCLGNGKAAILQNHGLLTVGSTIDAAAFWFMSLDKTCERSPWYMAKPC